ncbi:tyrosine-protein phosphatase non-receptor type 13-like isoform X2 [Salvelinus namaycush]|uniref:Tyrosine-protein phosphatase non-receptor type 13-like isoform X2 n=1 Tax=Salvelinus namaycush TaxID=8040 RepID=A0A8U0QQS9_SALNM|nr:tyrosine-protein phosphatase non-receptor type 13-like isoform X2 [Salvelinus namaycush]
MADEPHVDLELPGSIVSKKGRSSSSQREVSVVLPSGQSVLVRCDKKSRGRDVFDMVVAHANLVEHFYFGLAFIDDDEYFFLDHEIKISKVAPDSWKKVVSTSFLVFLRVKFFVDDISFILHRVTRHQYYLQLRKDILEDRLYCNEETCMFLAALALQAEFGDYMSELYGRNYYQPEQYVSKRMLEKMALPTLKEELSRFHANNAQMLPEEAETEFLKIAQQLPEYGMMFHRVGREKKPVVGELVLGVCATGIIVYELKNHLRTVTRRFLWRETDTISANRCKLTIECGGPSSKKHNFVTESSKIAQYLLSLCSAQHKFHSEMTSRQLNYSIAQDENIEKYQSICRTRDSHMKRLSCSEVVLNSVEIPANLSQRESLSKLCDDITAKVEACLRQQSEMREINRDLPEPCPLSEVKEQAWSTSEPIPRIISNASLQKQDSEGFLEAPSTSSSIRVDTLTRGSPEREIICLVLRKDPKLGFGFVIVGEDNTGILDLGIFIASIVPYGPADRDGKIRPGGRLISLNKISLQGVTFTNAAAILQSSPDEVELIVSQPKCSLRDSKGLLPPSTRDSLRDSKTSLAPSTQSLMLERGFGSQTTLNGTEEALALSNMATSKHGKRLHNPVVRILDAQVVRLLLEKELQVASQSQSGSLRRDSSMEMTLSGKTKDYSFVTDDNTLDVRLKKTLCGLGFSFYISELNSGSDQGSSVVQIKTLFKGQPAQESGQIREGDIILTVNGRWVSGLSYQRVLFLLSGALSEVHLTLCRPVPGVLSQLHADTLVPFPSPTSGVRSKSLDIRLGEDYSQLLKLQSHQIHQNHQYNKENQAQKGPMKSSYAQEQASSQESQDSEMKAAEKQPSSLSPTPPSPPSPISLASRSDPADHEELSVVDEEVSEEISLASGGSKTSVSLICIRDEADGGLTYCLMGDQITILADQEYLTISSTSDSPSSLTSKTSRTPSVVSHTTSHTPRPRSTTPTSVRSTSPNCTSIPHSLSSQTTSSTNPNLSSKTTSVQQTRSQPSSRPPSSLSSRMSDLNISHSVHHPQPQPATPPLPSLSSHTANPNSRTSDRKHSFTSNRKHSITSDCKPSITFKTTNASNIISTVIQYHPQPPDTLPLSQPPTHHPFPQPPPSSLSPLIQPAPLPCTNTTWRQETEGEEDENDDEDPRKVMMEFEMCVVLTKLSRSSFGFTITRSKLDACYYIQDILDNPAKTDGRLRPGDRLITVNGQDVTNVTDEVAMSILRSSPRRLSMTLGRAVTNLIAPPSPDNLQDIILHKTPTGQLGIKLTGGIGSKRQGIYCLEVVPGSPACEEGSIQPNDRILYICGRCTMGMTLEDAVKACENAPRKVKLKATRDDQPVTPKAKRNGLSDLREWKKEKEWKYFTHFEEPAFPEPETPTEQAKAVTETTGKFRSRLFVTSDQDSCILQIDVCKPEGGWLGFALIGGCNGSVLRVKKICTGGVAQQDGRLRVGDILLEVNGIIVSGLSHSKVVDILRKVKGNVQLIICRDIIPRVNTAPCTDGSFYMASCPRDNIAACPGSNTASCPGSGSNMASCLGSNMASCPGSNMASCPGSNMSPCPGSNMMTCQGVNMAISTGSNMASCSRSNMASCPGSHVTACPEAHMGDKAELVSNPAACSLPDVQQEDLPPELTSDPVPYVEEDITPLSPPPLSPPHHPAHRLQALTGGMAGQESCNSTPSHPACCLSSKSVTNLLYEASDRNQISVTTLGEPITGSKKSQSDGWSSEDEDDGTFEANDQEMMSPSSGPPIISEEELASLAMISPAKTSQYSGPRVKALIQILQHQLDQQELVREFMALEHLKPFDNCLVGKAPENREKNRYQDILPYDKTRVLVGDNQDYINASYIRMEVGSEEFFYISCQGPLPSTVPDFWQMVWENRSDVIAMMTQDVEKGRVKCHRYWPKKVSCPLDTGRFHLSLENQQILEYFHIKIIRMVEKESGKTHFVRHLKFTRWPDHGVPQCSEQLVRFIRYLRAVHHKGPVTVHCSAGIGRTGVLICTDVILSLIEYDLPNPESEDPGPPTKSQVPLKMLVVMEADQQWMEYGRSAVAGKPPAISPLLALLLILMSPSLECEAWSAPSCF